MASRNIEFPVNITSLEQSSKESTTHENEADHDLELNVLLK